jgi:hypothetical protein
MKQFLAAEITTETLEVYTFYTFFGLIEPQRHQDAKGHEGIQFNHKAQGFTKYTRIFPFKDILLNFYF